MPIIKNYQRRTSAPKEGGFVRVDANQFGAGTARAMGAVGKSITKVSDAFDRVEEGKEVSDLNAKLTHAQKELSIELNNVIKTTKPGDTKPFENFERASKETLDAIGGEYETRKAKQLFTDTSARISAQLGKTSAMGQSELAGVKAVRDHNDTLNNLSASTMADPSSFEMNKESYRTAVDALVGVGGMSTEQAAKLKEQGEFSLAKASVRGWIDLNPEHAKKKIDDGDFDKDLGADGKAQMVGEADQAIRGMEIEKQRKVKEKERVKKLRQKETQNDMLISMNKGKLTDKDILGSNLEAFGLGSKEQFLNLLKKRNSPEHKLKTDAAVMMNLLDRIHLPESDPNRLIDENELNQHFGNGLSWADMNRLRDELQGKNTIEGGIESEMKAGVLTTAKNSLTKSNPLMGIKDPIGDTQYQRYMIYFMDTYREERKKGKTARELLNPDSKDYLGKEIQNYVRTPKQIIKDLARGLRSSSQKLTAPKKGETPVQQKAPKKDGPLQRNKGESAADYINRVKGK